MRKEYKIKQFKLPIEEALLNRVINDPDCFILDKRIELDRNGDYAVYLEYERCIHEDECVAETYYDEDTDILFD